MDTGPPQFNWELEAKWARMILGPLPALITRTIRGQQLISPNRPTWKPSNVTWPICGGRKLTNQHIVPQDTANAVFEDPQNEEMRECSRISH